MNHNTTICIVLMLLMLLTGGPASAAKAPAADPANGPAAASQGNALTNQTQLTDIYDIKPIEPVGYNPDYLRYALYAGLAIAGIAIIAAAVMFRNKRRRKPIQDIIAHRCPAEEAFQLLNQISGLMDTDGRQFYFQLSMILRGYIQQRFSVDALEMTSEELMPCIGQLGVDRELHRGIKDFLNVSDPVKFAGIVPDRRSMQSHLEFVKTFVKQTPSKFPVADDRQPITDNG